MIPPPQAAGMIAVDKVAFFAAIGPRNVHPRTVVETLKSREHVSVWETPQRTPIGVSVSDSHGANPTRFFLASATVKALQEIDPAARDAGGAEAVSSA